MYNLTVFKEDGYADIFPLNAKRGWMDETYNSHAYKCFPVTLSNTLGWGISFPEDITFIWDGISDSSPDHVNILQGSKYVSTGRANGTISFNTKLFFTSNKNISLLHMPVPNQWIDGAQAFTSILSTSVLRGSFPCVWKITRPNTEITIKSGTPVIAIVPIELSEINNSEIEMKNISDIPEDYFMNNEHYRKAEEINKSGKWTNFYRDAVDYEGKSIGEHELKSIKLKVINKG